MAFAVCDRCLRARICDDGFHVHFPRKAAGLTVFQQVGVFGGFLAVVPRLIADLNAAQPFDPHIAFPTRNDNAQRITLLRTQCFTVHFERQHAVIHRFFHRDGAAI